MIISIRNRPNIKDCYNWIRNQSNIVTIWKWDNGRWDNGIEVITEDEKLATVIILKWDAEVYGSRVKI